MCAGALSPAACDGLCQASLHLFWVLCMRLCHCGLVLSRSIHCCVAGKTLHQLTYTDSPLLKECCLYKLAFQPCLELFKWVVLIASPQVRSAADSQWLALPSGAS